MSEQEQLMCHRILEGIKKAQRQMLERKVKLGEPVVYADADGTPYMISASEALSRLDNNKVKS